ncbi:MAG: hypothetical protein ACFFDN_44550 [Candidatus Hodarchaeota archaeon]
MQKVIVFTEAEYDALLKRILENIYEASVKYFKIVPRDTNKECKDKDAIKGTFLFPVMEALEGKY